jgi:hypothetical protein
VLVRQIDTYQIVAPVVKGRSYLIAVSGQGSFVLDVE